MIKQDENEWNKMKQIKEQTRWKQIKWETIKLKKQL